MLLGHFQSFLSSKTFDPLVIHMPDFPMQKGGYPAVALPSIRTGPFHHSFYQPPLATWNILLAPLGKTWLAQDATSPTPRHAIMP